MPLLSDVVAMVESSNNPLAIRYEPDFNPSLDAIRKAKEFATGGYIDFYTAQMICRTSWGKYQIMGDNLYGLLGMSYNIHFFLGDTFSQRQFFDAFLKKRVGIEDVDFSTLTQSQLVKFGNIYNGNGIAYSEALEKTYRTIT